MHPQDDALSQTYDLRGWRMHFVFDTEKLNALRWRYHEGRPDDTRTDTVDFVHKRPSGWLTTRCVLGAPLLQFPTDSSEKISVARRFVSFNTYEFRRDPGDPYADILEVVAGTRNERMALFQAFRLDQCVGTYKYNGDTIFTLTASSDFSIGFLGREERDQDAGLPFKFRFDELPADEKVVVIPKTAEVSYGKWLMQDLRFYPRKVQGQLSHILYIANAGEGNGALPTRADGESTDKPVIEESALGCCYLDARNIPEQGYYGADFEELAQILFPRGYARFTGLDEGEPGEIVAAARLVYAYDLGSEAVPDAALYSSHVNPLVRVVSAGSPGQRMVLNTVNPGVPTWQFISQSVGRLVPDGRYCDYIPQDDGGVIYSDSPLTRKKAALLTSLNRDPVDIVRILSGFTLLPYYSTMVVLNARPTHYFKLATAGNKLQLTFCYQSFGNGEQVVPPEDTEWKVLAGDGKVSGGIFTPGVINKFSVVQAIHRHPVYMQFAVIVIPVPLLAAAEFVAMRDGG